MLQQQPVTATVTPPKTSVVGSSSPSGTIVNVPPITRPNIISGLTSTTNAIQGNVASTTSPTQSINNGGGSETPAQTSTPVSGVITNHVVPAPSSSSISSSPQIIIHANSTSASSSPGHPPSATGVILTPNSVVVSSPQVRSTTTTASSNAVASTGQPSVTGTPSIVNATRLPVGSSPSVVSNLMLSGRPVSLTPGSSGASTSLLIQPSTPIRGLPPGTTINSAPSRILLSTKDQTPMIIQTSTTSGTPGSQVISSSGQAVQLVNRASVSQSGQPVLVSNPSSGVPQQIVFMRTPGGQLIQTSAPGTPTMQRTLAPRGVMNGPLGMVRVQGGNIRPGTQQILQPQMVGSPTPNRGFLVKTDQGFQFFSLASPGPVQPGQQVRLQTLPVSSGAGGMRPQGITVNLTQGSPSIRQQLTPHTMASSPVQTSTSHIVSQTPLHPPQSQMQQQQVPVQQPLSVQTTQANTQASSNAPAQMSPNTAKRKCKNFLSTLIKLATDQPEQVATNVRNLIQGLIDGVIVPEDFTDKLQRELKSSPQPCLVPFLKKSLPHLRQSLASGELSIEGVNPPSRMTIQAPVVMGQPHIPLFTGPRPLGMRLLSGAVPVQTHLQPSVTLMGPPRPGIVPPSALQVPHLPPPPITPGSAGPYSTPTTPASKAAKRKKDKKDKEQEEQSDDSSTAAPPKPKKTKKEKTTSTPKEKSEKKISSHLREDDDINDVAAMGGVNLQEESQRMAAAANEVGTQIRSCKDENFLLTTGLSNRINRIAARFCLEECPPEVVSLVSHAAQERLKVLAERLGIIAEHRLESLKMNPKYEVTQDVRAQVKFLEELDKLEKKRHEEQEREMLLRAAKSRSKLEDPEQLKLKQKAKEMQRAEMEEARQREANETALMAIGSRRKRLKLDGPSVLSPSSTQSSAGASSSLAINNTPNNHFSNSIFNTPFGVGSSKVSTLRRIKRVNMKDLLFLMEQDRCTSKSNFLYRTYVK